MYIVHTFEEPKRYLVGAHWTRFRSFAEEFEQRSEALDAAMENRRLLPRQYDGRIKITRTD